MLPQPLHNDINSHTDCKITVIDLRPSQGGAWKVAYADFVTAMMAFFLLLWLLNVTTDEQKNAISNYFDPTPTTVSSAQSGAGGVMGGLTMSPQGAMSSTMNPLIPPQQQMKKIKVTKEKKSKLQKAKEAAEEKRFKSAEEELKKAIEKNPELAKLAKNLLIDMTPEGLRIQIIDQNNESMFPSGSAKMYEKTKQLLITITNIILTLPNQLSIRGHTDSSRYAEGATYTNWELSADRANASRRVIMGAGLPFERVHNIMGKSDREHLNAENPLDPKNRRITIILLKEELTAQQEEQKKTETADDNAENKDTEASPEEQTEENTDGQTDENYDEDIDYPPQYPPVGTFRKTPGQVEFP